MKLEDPPPVLFYRGELRECPLVGVVGTRKPNSYTHKFVKDIVRDSLASGYGVVSGGAVGVDTWAHEETIKNSGYGVCILGFGLLKARGSLFERLLKSNGVLISELMPYESGDKFTFPKRNRLIAGMSEFLIVPEAGSKSGALITARYAHKLGKKVFVHIGIGRSSNWDGCYKLLKEGTAEILKDGSDIFGESREDTPLEEFLKTPRTISEVAEFLGCGESQAIETLTTLELEGKVHRIGALFSS